MRAPSKANVLNKLAYVTAALALAVLGCVGWAFLFERPYLSYSNLPFPAVPTVRAGEAVELTITRCSRSRSRRSYLTTHVLRNEASGLVALLPEVLVDIEPGCISSLSRINVVPASTAPGWYTVSGQARVDGLVVTHHVAWASTPFQVLPAPPAKEK